MLHFEALLSGEKVTDISRLESIDYSGSIDYSHLNSLLSDLACKVAPKTSLEAFARQIGEAILESYPVVQQVKLKLEVSVTSGDLYHRLPD